MPHDARDARGVFGLAIHRAPHSGHVATAAAHVCVHLVTLARIQPPSVQNASSCRKHEPLPDGRIIARQQWPSMQSGPQDRRSVASARPSGGLAIMAATTRMIANVPTSCRRCRRPPSCCSCHLLPKQPDPAIDRGSVGVSFSSSHRVGSSSKRCLPEVKVRCVLAGRHRSRAIWSTLSARRANLRRFTRSVGRRYPPRSNALRVSHRTWTGTRTRRVCQFPSGRHGRAVSEAAVAGTWTALGHRETLK